LALTAGASLINSAGQAKTARKQQQANEQWVAFQDAQKRRFEQREDENRDRAVEKLNENLEQGTGEARMQQIEDESARLTDQYTEGLPDVASDLIANAQMPGRSEVFDEALASSLADATNSARERIKAMATATAYGSGSRGSMGLLESIRNADTATDIGAINQSREGDTNVLRRYQQIQPKQYEYRPSPLVPIMGAAGQIIAGSGGGLAGTLAGAAAAAPTTSLRPRARPANLMAPGAF
jgi:hypothetical protein